MNTIRSADFRTKCFSAREAAEHMRISRSMLYKLIGARRLIPVKIGSCTIITGAEIERCIARLQDHAKDCPK